MEVVWNKLKIDNQVKNAEVVEYIKCPQCGCIELAKIYNLYVITSKTTINYVESDIKVLQSELADCICPNCKIKINI